MLVGKITPNKTSYTTTPHQSRYYDDDTMYCGYPATRRAYSSSYGNNHVRSFPAKYTPEAIKEALKNLRTYITKSLPEQGFLPGIQVKRKTPSVTDVGTIIFLSFDPVSSVKFLDKGISFEPIVVQWFENGRPTYQYNYAANELEIVPPEEGVV